MTVIKVGFLISYDYEYIKASLPLVYDHADEIFFAVDVYEQTWSGSNLQIPADFWEWVESFDKESKIRIYRDQFYLPGLSPMECDTRERNLLGVQMGKADWYVQIDADEYFVNFKSFVDTLRGLKSKGPTTVSCRVLTLFKELETGFVFIDESEERLNFATNRPVYELARNNDPTYTCIHLNDTVVHQSWARSSEEIYQKLNNWSHKNDFNVNSFFRLWDAIDEFNFHALRNFHPLTPDVWPRLTLFKGSIDEILASPKVISIGRPQAPRKKSFLSRLWRTVRRR